MGGSARERWRLPCLSIFLPSTLILFTSLESRSLSRSLSLFSLSRSLSRSSATALESLIKSLSEGGTPRRMAAAGSRGSMMG